MPDDLQANHVQLHDTVQFEIGGTTRNTTVMRYMLGRFGPFEHTFDRAPQKHEIEQVFAERRRALEGLV